MFKNKFAAALLMTLSLAATSSLAATTADNTGMNKRDQGQTMTPPDQARSTDAELEVTRKIRQDLVSDNMLSADAKNIKIITVNKTVTLRGPVHSQAEIKRILGTTERVARGMKINNQLEVTK